MNDYIKIESKQYPHVIMRVIPGHFVTPHAHINYYVDLTPLKCRVVEAQATAQALSEIHYFSTPVDTIVAMEGTEVIGGFLAEDLTRAGVMCMNAHKSIYVISPEYTSDGQIIFRDNVTPWIKEKNVLLLLATATTGKTVAQAIESLKYYGATISGVSAIFSTATKAGGLPIYSVFTQQDLPDYKAWPADACLLCKDHVPVDAIANAYGYTPLQ
ncbi:MAG: orotate phosphoribosyltransferase [Lachnospiraceae bacterium]|nr:orotate phosphoribosyltransferase [Lachnospiraceae bacterium]